MSKQGRSRDPELDEAIPTLTVDLLGEVGYAYLTMDRIAVRAGVSKASLCLRWPGKAALVAEAIEGRGYWHLGPIIRTSIDDLNDVWRPRN